MKVDDVMTRDVVSLKPDDNVRDAIGVLFDKKISGLPVIDTEGKLIGMFTEKEVMSSILPGYLERVGKFVYEENPKIIKQKVAKLMTMRVKEVMRKTVATVAEGTTLCEVAHLVLTQKVRRLPVLNKAGQVVGMVSREDVLKGLLK
ncbi:MAG: CBS domain-containing protein [Candidatus Omnitrophota bacterium]